MKTCATGMRRSTWRFAGDTRRWRRLITYGVLATHEHVTIAGVFDRSAESLVSSPGTGTRRFVRFTLIASVLAASLWSAVMASHADALNIRWYSYQSPCYTAKDPITVIFDTNAYFDWIDGSIYSHTGWSGTGSSAQYFETGGYCNANNGDRASGSGDRYHIRFKQGNGIDPVYGVYGVGTPHYETSEGCGHVVRKTIDGWSGFDMGRQHMASVMWDHHAGYMQYRGNAAAMVQCNGDTAASNGNVLYLYIFGTT